MRVTGFISDSLLEQVRQGADIVDVISSYLSLTKAGQNFKGLCPFHQEKTPSFMVSSSKQMFHCFGCGEGGDVFQFLMKSESVSFLNAVQMLADRLGIVIPQQEGAKINPEEDQEKRKIREIHELAGQYYHRLLLTHAGAEKARSYLRSRGLDEKVWVDFSLGYALPQWSDLIIFLERKGFKKTDLERTGLVLSGQYGFYDRFRGRVVFPIFDSQNKMIGFGGRVLDQSMPKYLNSPETILFQKGKHLYGFGGAKEVVGRKPFVVVEGYFDVITGHRMGMTNVVGTMGTALTPQHLRQMGRFTQEIVLVFDSDLAGQKAAMRGGDLLLGSDYRVRVVSLPQNEDPDSFLRRHGRAAFEKCLEQAVPLMDFLIQGCLGEKKKLSVQEKVQLSQKIFPYIAKLNSHVERSHYLGKLAETLEVPEQDLLGDFSETFSKKDQMKATPRGFKAQSYPKDEEILCHLFLQGKVDGEKIQKLLGGFSDQRILNVVTAVLENQNQKGVLDHDPLGYRFSEDEEERRLFSQLMVRELEYDDVEKTVEDCVASVNRRWIKREITTTQKSMESAEREGNLEVVRELQRNIIHLRKQLYYPETPCTPKAGVV